VPVVARATVVAVPEFGLKVIPDVPTVIGSEDDTYHFVYSEFELQGILTIVPDNIPDVEFILGTLVNLQDVDAVPTLD
jgi:hypothetical protein